MGKGAQEREHRGLVRALVLDFDGVISDSAPESFLVSLVTYVELKGGTSLGAVLERVERGGIRRGEIEREPLYRRYLGDMPLGNRAEDYAVVLRCAEEGIDLPDQRAYDRARGDVAASFLDEFHRRFYEVRRELSKEKPAAWRALFRPYPGMSAILRRLVPSVELAVATAKDRRSVEMLLYDYGLKEVFPAGRVLDKETGVSKRAHLEHLGRLLCLPFAAMTFVDDKVNHLEAVAPLGVRCLLAGWGYNGPRERRLAGQRGFAVCGLGDFERTVLG